MKKRIAIVGAILENPKDTQMEFNNTISSFKGIIKGRMGIPYDDLKMSVISLVIIATIDEINSLTGKLGNIKGVTVKTSISKKEV